MSPHRPCWASHQRELPTASHRLVRAGDERDAEVVSSDDDLSARIVARVAELTATRSWPWMQPGTLSVGMDEDGRIVEYLAEKDSLVPVRVLRPSSG